MAELGSNEIQAIVEAGWHHEPTQRCSAAQLCQVLHNELVVRSGVAVRRGGSSTGRYM